MNDITPEQMQKMADKYEGFTEEQLLTELSIDLMKSNPEAIIKMLDDERGENEPPATQEDVDKMLEHADEMRAEAKEKGLV